MEPIDLVFGDEYAAAVPTTLQFVTGFRQRLASSSKDKLNFVRAVPGSCASKTGEPQHDYLAAKCDRDAARLE